MINNTEFTKNVYMFLSYAAYILYVVIYLGAWNKAPQYLDDINYYLKVFIGIVLVVTFNPIVRFRPSSIHRNISFSAGLLLLTSTTFSTFQNRLNNTVKRMKNDVLK
jgi:glucan phosphoethanolaminetransferase (alkaline phosphatase superfamily)